MGPAPWTCTVCICFHKSALEPKPGASPRIEILEEVFLRERAGRDSDSEPALCCLRMLSTMGPTDLMRAGAALRTAGAILDTAADMKSKKPSSSRTRCGA